MLDVRRVDILPRYIFIYIEGEDCRVIIPRECFQSVTKREREEVSRSTSISRLAQDSSRESHSNGFPSRLFVVIIERASLSKDVDIHKFFQMSRFKYIWKNLCTFFVGKYILEKNYFIRKIKLFFIIQYFFLFCNLEIAL